MVDPNQNPAGKPPPLTGPELAIEMVGQLAQLNATLAARTDVEGNQLKLMDELCGRLEVLTRACVIIAEAIDEGKPAKSIGIGDFALAVATADEEIMGEGEEEEEEDEPDPPLRR